MAFFCFSRVQTLESQHQLQGRTKARPARRPPIAANPNDWFEDVTQKSGIRFVHQFCHQRIANILLSNGSGAVVFDYDNDGLMDIYFLNWGPLAGVTSVRARNKARAEPAYTGTGATAPLRM